MSLRTERRAWTRRVKRQAWQQRRKELSRAAMLRIIGRYGVACAQPNPIERMLVGAASYQEFEFRVDHPELPDTIDIYEVDW